MSAFNDFHRMQQNMRLPTDVSLIVNFSSKLNV